MMKPLLPTLTLGFCAGLVLMSRLAAQSIPNPGFESDAYANWPGYAAGNGGAITGWTFSNPERVGLNPAGGSSPFGDNGTLPEGLQSAFLQSAAGGADLSTTISGLTPGTAYRLRFRANARAEQQPLLAVQVNGAPVALSVNFASPVAGPATITSVNSAHPYHFIECGFTAAGATAALTLRNDAAGDHTLCVDDFKIGPASEPLETALVASRWTNDADSGVEGQYRYTHARTFGGAATNATVNGVLFTPSFGGNPGALNHFSSTGFASNFGPQNRNIADGSNAVAQSFMYGGPNTSITLSGLKPSTTYVATIYGVGWEPGQRSADFTGSAGGGTHNVNIDAYGPANGVVVRYRYTTDATGSPVLIDYPQAAGSGSWHTAALSNRETVPGTTPNRWTVDAWNDDATSGVNDGATYRYTHAYNFNSAASTVINGINFVGVPGGNPSGADFATSGFAAAFSNDANNVTGGSRAMANDFLYNGYPGSLTLSGLTPGEEYVLTLFSVGWEDSGRFLSFSEYSQPSDNPAPIVDQDTFLNNNGIRINYTYRAPASGSVTVLSSPLVNASFHLYGFANRRTIPERDLAVTVQPQPVFITALGTTATFSASASGNPPIAFEWRRNGVPIPGKSGTTNLTATLTIENISAADAGDYSCAFTGSGQGTVVTENARLHLITDAVAGLFDTAVGAGGEVIADGGSDPHYTLFTNPDGAADVPATVHDSLVFPIVAGPWLANTDRSKWIAPQLNTVGSQGDPTDAGAGPGVYVYRTTFDLTGFDLATVRISGSWATDNEGVGIFVNGTATGLKNAAQFAGLTPFVITKANGDFRTGANVLEFHVRNASPGYTGLRVEGLAGFGTIAPGTVPFIAAQPADTTVTWGSGSSLLVSASGSATLTYQWTRNGQNIAGANGSRLLLPANDPTIAGTYQVTISNSSGSIASRSAVVTLADAPIFPGSLGIAAAPGSSSSIKVSSITGAATGGSGPITLIAVQSGLTAAGGSVAIVGDSVIYTPAAGFTGADSFTYILGDNIQSSTGTVAVAVGTGFSTAASIVGFTREGAGQRVVASGLPGTRYQLQWSASLTSWTDLGSPQLCPDSGVLSVLDPGPLPASRFYRSVQLP
jgi:hypothetical protein